MFWKKKKVVDIRDLQRQGRIRIPKRDIVVPTDNSGFVDLSSESDGGSVSNVESPDDSGKGFMGFMDVGGSSDVSSSGGVDSRKISQQLSDLDNKLYKLEQRLELIERKVGVGGSSSESSVGPAGW